MTGTFLTRLELYELEGWDGEWYCLLSDLIFRDENGLEYTAPAGALTNFTSVPRVLWSLIPKIGKHTRATVIHDAAYRGEIKRNPPDVITRRDADRMFLHAMESLDVSWLTRHVMWMSVRIGGRRLWPGDVPA